MLMTVNYANYPPFEICEDLIVQVTDIQTTCSTPRTFYYGSGVNRDSVTCNYGDKATTTVYFDVEEDLYDTNIYVVMSFYAGYGNEVLTATSPKNIKKYVGYEVQSAGSYSYTYSTTLGSSGRGSGAFIPYIQIAFSSETNGGKYQSTSVMLGFVTTLIKKSCIFFLLTDYNLGAANIPCRWDDQELGEWTEITAKSSQFTTRDFVVEYGILIGTVVSADVCAETPQDVASELLGRLETKSFLPESRVAYPCRSNT